MLQVFDTLFIILPEQRYCLHTCHILIYCRDMLIYNMTYLPWNIWLELLIEERDAAGLAQCNVVTFPPVLPLRK